MISFSKTTLDINKLHMLLLERRALIISDFIKSSVARGDGQEYRDFNLTLTEDKLELSYNCRSGSRDTAYSLIDVSDSHALEFKDDGSLKLIWNSSSSNLTIEDLIKFGILDESKVVYVATYEASDEPYSTECRLMGVYSSFAEYQLQASKIIGGVEDVDVNVVKLNALEDLFLNGYQE